MLEFSANDFKVIIIKKLQEANINTLETNKNQKMSAKKQKCKKQTKKNKTLNATFIIENYNNQNLKLSVWVQWQNGGKEERISELKYRTIEITKAEERGIH